MQPHGVPLTSSFTPTRGIRIAGCGHTATKAYFEGTHRVRAPAETLAAYRPLMPMMGITRLANITGLDRIGLPVWMAVRPNARALTTSQGKGRTPEAAQASALMEAIESWHGERIATPVTVAAYRDLPKGLAADPADLALRSDTAKLHERPIEWIEGWDLVGARTMLVPFDTVSTNFVEHPERRALFLRTTNGLASGNHLLEAIVHGLLEVIERDALTLWQFRKAADKIDRAVDIATIRDSHLTGLLETLRRAGIGCAIDELTTDVAVPAYTCTLIDDQRSEFWRPVPRASGHGAHMDPVIALSRAIHEAVQSRATLISGSRDDMFPRDYAAASRPHAASAPAPAARRSFVAEGGPANDSFEGDLAVLLERVVSVGLGSVVAVDLTRSEVGVAVVKIVAPGLEPVRTGHYRPGRRARAMLAEGGA